MPQVRITLENQTFPFAHVEGPIIQPILQKSFNPYKLFNIIHRRIWTWVLFDSQYTICNVAALLTLVFC